MPANWRELLADLAWFYRWSPREVGGLTIQELVWWCEQANRIRAERQKELAGRD